MLINGLQLEQVCTKKAMFPMVVTASWMVLLANELHLKKACIVDRFTKALAKSLEERHQQTVASAYCRRCESQS